MVFFTVSNVLMPRLFISGYRSTCLRCGKGASIVHRTPLRRIFCLAACRCDSCGARWYHYRTLFMLLQWNASCPLCHSYDIGRLHSKDKVDPMSLNPFRRLLFLFGAPVYYCTFCRFQFRDWRHRHPYLKEREQSAPR